MALKFQKVGTGHTHTHTHTHILTHTLTPLASQSSEIQFFAHNNFVKHKILSCWNQYLIISHVSNCGNKILLLTNDEATNSRGTTADCVILQILTEVSSVSCYWSKSLSLHNVAHQILWGQITYNCASAFYFIWGPWQGIQYQWGYAQKHFSWTNIRIWKPIFKCYNRDTKSSSTR